MHLLILEFHLEMFRHIYFQSLNSNMVCGILKFKQCLPPVEIVRNLINQWQLTIYIKSLLNLFLQFQLQELLAISDSGLLFAKMSMLMAFLRQYSQSMLPKFCIHPTPPSFDQSDVIRIIANRTRKHLFLFSRKIIHYKSLNFANKNPLSKCNHTQASSSWHVKAVPVIIYLSAQHWTARPK